MNQTAQLRRPHLRKVDEASALRQPQAARRSDVLPASDEVDVHQTHTRPMGLPCMPTLEWFGGQICLQTSLKLKFPDTPCMPYMPTLAPLAPLQLIGIYGSPIGVYGKQDADVCSL